jgi:hypothetical protein
MGIENQIEWNIPCQTHGMWLQSNTRWSNASCNERDEVSNEICVGYETLEFKD